MKFDFNNPKYYNKYTYLSVIILCGFYYVYDFIQLQEKVKTIYIGDTPQYKIVHKKLIEYEDKMAQKP